MAYRLLAADFDKTLTRSDRTVSDRTKETIRRVLEHGNFVTLATGRLHIAPGDLQSLFPGRVPLIFCNGGVLQDALTREVYSEEIMEYSSALAMIDWCRRQKDGCFIVWCRAGHFGEQENEPMRQYMAAVGFRPEKLPSAEFAAQSGVYKLLFVGEASYIARKQAELLADPPAKIAVFQSSPECMEIVPPQVNKGYGLMRAAEILGIPRREVIAIGDGENDIPMLRWAGLGVAMENSPDCVKAAADEIAPHCDEDGAAFIMEKYLLSPSFPR